MSVQFSWRGGFAHGDAQVVGEELKKLERGPDDRIDPQDVVNAARPDESVLHPQFEWRDEMAAEQFRLYQARTLIKSVVVRYAESPDIELPAYVCVAQGEAAPYQATRVALAQSDSRHYVLARARRELEGWRKRYADLDEFASVVRSIDEVLAG